MFVSRLNLCLFSGLILFYFSSIIFSNPFRVKLSDPFCEVEVEIGKNFGWKVFPSINFLSPVSKSKIEHDPSAHMLHFYTPSSPKIQCTGRSDQLTMAIQRSSTHFPIKSHTYTLGSGVKS